MAKNAYRRQLDKIARDTLSRALNYVGPLRDEDLARVHRELTSLSTTNCSWALYKIKPLLLDIVGDERLRRSQAAESREG